MTKAISLKGLTKTFQRASGEVVRAIDDVSIEVGAGEFLVLLGPSGCGKTTLLRCLAGLETPSAGRIEIDGEPVFDHAKKVSVPPESRRMGMIFQSYALWPHMTVKSNVAYPLKAQGKPDGVVTDQVRQALSMVGIPELEDQYPGQISGGQQQRVALARALVSSSDVVLFDEPLSNVDAKVREQLRFEIRRMHQELGFTAVYVTHDQEEAMALATRIAVLHQGKVEQLASPADVYNQPASLTVARFIGTLNELPGRVVSVDNGTCRIDTSIGSVDAAVSGFTPGDDVIVGIRPEALTTIPPETMNGAPNHWRASADVSVFLGARNEYVLAVQGVELRMTGFGRRSLAEGETVAVTVAPEHVHVFHSGNS